MGSGQTFVGVSDRSHSSVRPQSEGRSLPPTSKRGAKSKRCVAASGRLWLPSVRIGGEFLLRGCVVTRRRVLRGLKSHGSILASKRRSTADAVDAVDEPSDHLWRDEDCVHDLKQPFAVLIAPAGDAVHAAMPRLRGAPARFVPCAPGPWLPDRAASFLGCLRLRTPLPRGPFAGRQGGGAWRPRNSRAGPGVGRGRRFAADRNRWAEADQAAEHVLASSDNHR